jgi:hypothetical protein
MINALSSVGVFDRLDGQYRVVEHSKLEEEALALVGAARRVCLAVASLMLLAGGNVAWRVVSASFSSTERREETRAGWSRHDTT